MSFVSGEMNHWQTGVINSAAHAIEKCGSHTGHAVRAVAYCDSDETAEILVDALAQLKEIYDANPTRNATIKKLLERAGLVS